MAAEKQGRKRSKSSDASNAAGPIKESILSVPESSKERPTAAAVEDAATGSLVRPGLSVAGIVGSAGGLDAFKKFFAAMPVDSGIAFVLVPHLDPTHQSLMVELLARQTSMPVVEATEGALVEANRVYIIPPNKNMTISGGVLRLTGPIERGSWQTSIDLFLRSLAEDRQEKAICIILSGTGSHGTLGLKAVKAAGGLAMVQEPSTAAYPLMPESAAATGLADYILPVERMPESLVNYVRRDDLNRGKIVAAVDGPQNHLNEIISLLRLRTKLDFRSYRKTMLARRLERRMGLGQFENLEGYLEHLRRDPEELDKLSRDLLISVTRFFRDSEAFGILETEVLATLVRVKGADSPIRAWVPGCATGEEPYSIAMLILEQMGAADSLHRVQIFATDVDAQAIAVARRGVYPEGVTADVSPERLARFFTRVEESAWQIKKDVRETVTFAIQNLITDAPFSKMDLISCRNVLIYLEPELQRKILAVLHFALNDGGCLILGPSETVGRQIDLFEPISKKWRIYRRIGPIRSNELTFASAQIDASLAPSKPAGEPQGNAKLAELAQNSLLRRFGVACVVINRNCEIQHFAGPTEEYLAQPGGPPTLNLISLARRGLESKLGAVVQKAIRENEAQSVKGVAMHGDELRRVNIEVEPLNPLKPSEGLLLVSFQLQTNPPKVESPKPKPRTERARSGRVRSLEQELERTRDELQSTIEEYESANEELKASNEEVMSMNEELQSANEELETSKEELQSFNEELTTVNNQLHDKIEEVESATNDMSNLLNSTESAAVFLDLGLRVKLFTPAATRLFSLIATDRGRPIRDIATRFSDDDLETESQLLLLDLAVREKEVRTKEGRWYSRRIMPYRTLDNRIDGVVVTFVDITERKQAADSVVRRLAAVVENSADAIFNKDLDGTIRTWNRGAERLYGYSPGEVIGRSVKILVPDDHAEEWTKVMAMLARGEVVEQLETERVRKDGQRVAVSLTVSPILDGEGKVVSASVTGRDISQRKKAEQALRESERFARSTLDGLSASVAILDETGKILAVNQSWRQFAAANGAIPGNVEEGANYFDACRAVDGRFASEGPAVARGIQSVLSRKAAEFVLEYPCNGPDVEQWFVVRVTPFPGDAPRRVVVAHENITSRKRLEREVVEVASQEQRRIGQDLHDSVGQELTALNMVAGDLAETLRSDSSKAPELVDRLVLGLRRSQDELRYVLRGLLPVSADAQGLMAALSDLANRTQQSGKARCVFDCPNPVLVEDNLIATQLYLIAQEAVHNSIKHAHCKNIHITVESDRVLILRVQDDGVGFTDLPSDEHDGLGIHIMRNRTQSFTPL